MAVLVVIPLVELSFLMSYRFSHKNNFVELVISFGWDVS